MGEKDVEYYSVELSVFAFRTEEEASLFEESLTSFLENSPRFSEDLAAVLCIHDMEEIDG